MGEKKRKKEKRKKGLRNWVLITERIIVSITEEVIILKKVIKIT